MKKIASLLLVVVLVMSLVGCGTAAADPKAELLAAIEKTNALECQDLKADIKIGMMGMEFEMPMTIKTVYKDGKVAAMAYDVDMMGQKVVTSFVDDALYMEAAGAKMKVNTDFETAVQKELLAVPDVVELSADVIESVTAGENDADGNKTYNVAFKQGEGSMGALVESIAGEGDYEMSDLVYTVSVNAEGYVSKVVFSAKFSTSAEGMTITMDMETTAEYVNPGQTFEITAPADAAEYIEVDINAIA